MVRQTRVRVAFGAALFATSMLAGVPAALAADTTAGPTVEEIVVTAQKKEENLQDVPVAVTAFSTKKLEQLHVENFNDYVKFLPSVAAQSAAPGGATVFMRGIASGANANHSGSLPSVGTYLDEQPITTIGGALDLHVYDIARVEALAGPQGTLYGASSQAGTLRIITNQPELGVLKGSYDLKVNSVDHGGTGYVAEGMVNIPVNDQIAIRMVAWDEHDAGYIDNVPGTMTYPTSGVTINNKKIAKNNYNDVDTYGARIALRLDLNDTWTIRPTFMTQDTKSNGVFGYDPSVGDLKVTHFLPEDGHDRWYQAAMTVQGKISDFDLVYSGGYMDRRIDSHSDYTDYSFFYDTLFGSGAYITDSHGNVIDPTQRITGRDHFTRVSNEIRLSSPQDQRLRFVVGGFQQRQTHFIEQNYQITGIDPAISVTGWRDTLWLTEQLRIDRDYAAFGELYFDITPKLTLTAGVRAFKSDNSLRGFYGFSSGFSSKTGEAACFAPNSVGHGPCTNLDKRVKETGETYKANLNYKIDDGKMVYVTYSQGFRPGGINRRSTLAPYSSDYVYNYEAGWKTQWADNSLRWNGAVYYEDWKDFQYSFLGPNAFTEILNAGQAQVKGVETELSWATPVQGLTVNTAASYTDAKLTEPYCGTVDAAGKPNKTCATPQAPSGTRLPVTPKVKANATARYEFPWGDFTAHVQGSAVYQSSSTAALPVLESAILGTQRAYGQLDLSAGLDHDTWKVELSVLNAFDKRGDNYRYAECPTLVCSRPYVVPNQPRTISISFGQKF
ncbi:TonB-dependent receptor [Phenylobacterium aquaticum]|uniref:TonB-dependent receptor n=2 Tax=Phenylobacterium aquaticum TaxID=1763816 RepID=UPI0026F2E9A0|nr:TonB-dependent receptor [Phenylobacterium aquaticum]